MNGYTYIWQVLHRARWWLSAQCFVAIIWAIDLSLRPYLIKRILDTLTITTPATIYADISLTVMLYIGMSLIMVGIFRLYDYIALMVYPIIKEQIILTLMDRLMHQAHTFYQTNFGGSLSNKVKEVMNHIPDLLQILIDRFFSHSLAIIIASATLWYVNTWLAAALTIWIILFCTVSFFMSKKAHNLSEEAAAKRSRLFGYIADVIGTIMTVRLFNGIAYEKERSTRYIEKYLAADRAREWYFLYLFTFQGISFVIYQSFCLWWLIRGFHNGTVTVGDFAFVLSINSTLVDTLWYLMQDFSECAEMYGTITQGLQTVLVPYEMVDAPGARQLVVTHGTIRFDHVMFQYKSQDVLFSDLSITIEGGKKVGLVGFSGSGKTTFVNLILRIFDLTRGAIYIDDQDIKLVSQASLRHAIGIIPQDPAFFNRSVMENIRYGKETATDEEVIAAAQKAHAHEFILRMPQGYLTMVGERGTKLSGGQRQRLAFARAILKDAPLLILDEATSALDTITEQLIQDALTVVMQGKTVLAVAHRLSTLKAMDLILVFDKGTIVETGTHEELLARGGLYAQLWNLQAGGKTIQDKKRITTA